MMTTTTPLAALSLVTAVDEELSWVLTSWLWSVETSNLRTASRECLGLFVRNVPAPTQDLFYRESLEAPKVCRCEAQRNKNKQSPLKCWPMRYDEVRNLIGDATALRDRDLALVAEDGFALEWADESFKRHGIVALAALMAKKGGLQQAHESFRGHRHVVWAAVAQKSSELQFADETLRQDKEFVLAAVEQNPMALANVDEALKSDRDIVLAAVTQPGYGYMLMFADRSLKQDEDVVSAAVSTSPLALRYADWALKTNRDFVLAAVAKSGVVLEYADVSLKRDKEFVKAALAQNADALVYADPSLKRSLRSRRWFG